MPIVPTSNPKYNRWKIDDFSGGPNTNDDPSEIPENQFAVFDNVVVNKTFDGNVLSKRDGISSYNANVIKLGASAVLTLGEYIQQNKTPNNTFLVAHLALTSGKTNNLFYTTLDSNNRYQSNSWTSIGTISYDSPVQFKTFKDNLYITNIANGASANKFWNGTNLLDVGCPPCDNTLIGPSPLLSGGSMADGSYIYVVVFVYDGYQDSGALIWDGFGVHFAGFNPRCDISGGSGAGRVSLTGIPIGTSPRVTARKIYRNKANEFDTLYYLTTITNNSDTTYIDSLNDTDLGDSISPLKLNQISKPLKARYQCIHKDRLFNGNLTENLYTPLNGNDITVTDSGGGGSLVSGATYTWRFWKCWYENNDGIHLVRYSPPFDITHTLGGGIKSVDISYNSSDDWYKLIAFSRSSSSLSADFKSTNLLAPRGIRTSIFPQNDGIADSARIDYPIDIIQAGTTYNYNSGIAWSETAPVSQPDIFSPNGFINLNQDDNDNITGLYSTEDGVIIFKERGIYKLFTSNSNDSTLWRPRKLIDGIGCNVPGSIIKTPDNKYTFIMQQITQLSSGISQKVIPTWYYWDGGGSSLPIIISNPIKGTLSNIATVSNPVNFSGAYNPDNQQFVYTFDYGTTYGSVLIFERSVGNGIWYYWYGSNVNLGLSSPYFTKYGDFIYGRVDAKLHQFTRNVSGDNISSSAYSIQMDIKTKEFDFGDRYMKIKKLFGQLNDPGNNTFTYNYFIDGVVGSSIIPATLGLTNLTLPVDILCKRLQLEIIHSSLNTNVNIYNLGFDFKQKYIRP